MSHEAEQPLPRNCALHALHTEKSRTCSSQGVSNKLASHDCLSVFVGASVVSSGKCILVCCSASVFLQRWQCLHNGSLCQCFPLGSVLFTLSLDSDDTLALPLFVLPTTLFSRLPQFLFSSLVHYALLDTSGWHLSFCGDALTVFLLMILSLFCGVELRLRHYAEISKAQCTVVSW